MCIERDDCKFYEIFVLSYRVERKDFNDIYIYIRNNSEKQLFASRPQRRKILPTFEHQREREPRILALRQFKGTKILF